MSRCCWPTLTAALTGCSQEAEVASPSTPSAEKTFLAVTAEHLCGVQSDVFEDPAELAAAYASAPEYDGITDDQVAELTARLTADPAFSAELRREIAESCG